MGLQNENKKKSHHDFLWKSFIKGKKWALSKIYSENYNDLYHYGIKIISNDDEIRDLIQDLFYKLWKNRQNLKQPDNVKAYLLRGLRTVLLDYIKVYKKKYPTTELTEEITFLLKMEHPGEMDEATDETTRKLYTEIEKLPSRQKEAIYLHYIKEYNYKQVAEIMNVNLQSVRNLVYEGLTKLKESKIR